MLDCWLKLRLQLFQVLGSKLLDERHRVAHVARVDAEDGVEDAALLGE